MPVALTENRHTQSGHAYADRTGVAYEFPRIYRRLVIEGTPFVYYRSREGKVGPIYFGTGVVGSVYPSPNGGGLLMADIRGFEPFDPAIYFKDAAGRPFERRAEREAGYYRQGVRALTDPELTAILEAADRRSAPTAPPPQLPIPTLPPKPERDATERYAVDVVLAELRNRYPESFTVREMPHSHPGYDIRVEGSDGAVARYVEVKGTRSAEPVFRLSEGERLFSITHANLYTFAMVWSIDLERSTHQLGMKDGAVDTVEYRLQASEWLGRYQTA